MHFCLNKQRHKTEKPDKVMAFQEGQRRTWFEFNPNFFHVTWAEYYAKLHVPRTHSRKQFSLLSLFLERYSIGAG